MIKKTFYKTLALSITTAILLTACGGGGGGGGSDSSSSSSSSSVIATSSTPATDYSTYAWGTNSSIDNSFKSTYNIDSNAHINLAGALARTKGKYINGPSTDGVKVAVIDEDFEVAHPDLSGKVISAFNAMNSTSNIADSDGDTFYHGSAVAGFIASTYIGVASEVQLILINIDLDSNSLSDPDLIRAFDHAQAQGAKVINCSWGGGNLSSSVQSKIAALKTAGITVVFASGNGDNSGFAYNLDTPGNNDPSELTSVIGVGATSAANDVTRYSNYGSAIDILAPGGGRDLNTPSITIGLLGIDQSGTAGYNNTQSVQGNHLVNTNYSFTQGTSFSAPILSGVAALMYAANPNLTPDRLREILITTSDKVGVGNGASYSDISGDGTTSTFDSRRAYGKVNANAAVAQAESEF